MENADLETDDVPPSLTDTIWAEVDDLYYCSEMEELWRDEADLERALERDEWSRW